MFLSAMTQFFSFRPFFYPPVKHATELAGNPQNLEALQALLIEKKPALRDWFPYQQAIANCIEKCSEDPCKLDLFLSVLIKHAIKENSPEQLAFLSSLISFEKIEQMLMLCKEGYQGIEKLAKEEASLHLKSEEKKNDSLVYKECRRLLLSFFSVIANFVDSILEVLSLSHSSKFRNLFDRNQMWDMFFKVFAFIPYVVVPLLYPFVSDKVYLVAVLLILSIGILTFCYKRWIKPLPTIINSWQIKEGKIHTVENTTAMLELIQSLAIRKPVLLVAKSGEGKTALIRHLVTEINDKSSLNGFEKSPFSQELKKLAGMGIKCGPMIGDISFGHIEQMEKLGEQVQGWHKKLFLFFDEFYQIVTNPNAFRMFKECFLKSSPSVRCVSAVTYEEFKKLREIDFDRSFRRCVHIIFIEGSSPTHLLLILKEFRKQKPKHIHISDSALAKIVELSESEEYLKGVGRPAKAESLLDTAAGICMAAYQGHYASRLSKEREKEEEVYQLGCDAYTYNDSSNAKEREDLIKSKQQIIALQNQLKKQYKEIEKIKSLFDEREKLKTKYVELTHVLANPASFQQVDRKTQTLYLLYHFYARQSLMTHIEESMEGDQLKDIPLQVNEKVVQQAFEALKKGEQQAHA